MLARHPASTREQCRVLHSQTTGFSASSSVTVYCVKMNRSSGRTNQLAIILLVIIPLAVGTGCLSSSSSAAPVSTVSVSTPVPGTDAAGTVWLCRPGIKDNPCTGNRDATSITGSNKRAVQSSSATGSKKYDCYYIYPTASNEATVNPIWSSNQPRG